MTRVLWLVVLISVVQCEPMSRDELEDFSNFLLKTSSLDLHVKKGADPDDAFDEDEVVSDNAWEESGKFEGDLILNDRQRRLIVENVEGLSRNGLTDSTKRWPNNEVIYFIQREHFTSDQVQAIQNGIDDLAQASCVKFRPYRKGDRDAVVIQGSRRGCFSQVGYQGGYQVLNLSGRHPVGRGCFRHGTVVHELLHSLGFYHMQSSPDRDDYIDVIWANIVQPARHNFRKYNSFSVSDFGVGYDYDSVLHYSRRAFSSNGQDTLVPKKRGAEIGQRVGLSDKDTQKLNKMYCDADNDRVEGDENSNQKPKIKKKKPKNQPFEGQGIGYHQGKTVVIKLPTAGTYKLSKVNVPSTHVFDFSKTPQVVSSPDANGYRSGKEMTYPYHPIISLNTKTTRKYQNDYDVKSIPAKNVQKYNQPPNEQDSFMIRHKNVDSSHFENSNEVKPEYMPIDVHDKDLKEAFHRLTKIVKEHVYPQNHDYVHKINKDYSEFLTPLDLSKSKDFHYSIDDKFKQPISYASNLSNNMNLKQTDYKMEKQELNKKSDNVYANKQMEDRMDNFYRTSLATKKPYSSYEQTETPQYATLEYLQGRHDFSNIYSPDTQDNNSHGKESYKDNKNKYDNVNVFDHGLHTDYIQNQENAFKTHSSKKDELYEDEKINKLKYKAVDGSNNKQAEPTNAYINDRFNSSYRILLPTKKPYSAYESTATPNYATLEYLKDRHDISSEYTLEKPDKEQQKESYYKINGELPPTETDWYKKASYKHNPANYDHALYSDNNYPNDKKRQNKETNDQSKVVPDYSDEEDSNENNTKLLNFKQDKLEIDDDFYTPYDKDDKKEDVTDSYDADKINPKETDNYGDTQDKGYTSEYGYDDEHIPKNNKSKQQKVKSYQDMFNDNNGEKGHTTPRKSQPYTLYGAPVPLTKEWFKPNYEYFTRDESGEDDYSRPNKYQYR